MINLPVSACFICRGYFLNRFKEMVFTVEKLGCYPTGDGISVLLSKVLGFSFQVCMRNIVSEMLPDFEPSEEFSLSARFIHLGLSLFWFLTTAEVLQVPSSFNTFDLMELKTSEYL